MKKLPDIVKYKCATQQLLMRNPAARSKKLVAAFKKR